MIKLKNQIIMKQNEILSRCCRAKIIVIKRDKTNRLISDAKCSECGNNMSYDLSNDTATYFGNAG